MSVVSNTSPLILLAKIGRLALLLDLYHEIIVPDSVLAEVHAKPSKEVHDIEVLMLSPGVRMVGAGSSVLPRLVATLGAGERAAIAVALAVDADLVLLDDLRGRQAARELGLTTTGTIGVLIEARSRGFVPSLGRELRLLVDAGMWIDETFYHRLLEEHGE